MAAARQRCRGPVAPRVLPYAGSKTDPDMSDTTTDWTVQRKAALVTELLAGTATLEAAASRHGLSAEQLADWVARARSGIENALRDAPLPARQAHGDLRDLIAQPFTTGGGVTVAPDAPLHAAWQSMRTHDISQLPVLDAGRIVGMLDESDVLLHVYGDEARFADSVSAAMVSRLDKVDVRAPIEALLPVFDRGHVAIVMEGEAFLGLITRIDMLNHLRAAWEGQANASNSPRN